MILITGAKGFLASEIAKQFHPDLQLYLGVDIDDCDLTDWQQVQALPDADEVWHFAAYNNTQHFYTRPLSVLQNTLEPTLNLLRRYPQARFIYASSSEIYAGAVNRKLIDVPTAETNIGLIDGIDNPRWSYAGAKLLGEIAVHSAHAERGIDYMILRYHNVYGPNQKAHFIPEFAERAKQGDYTLPGAWETRAFCHVEDAARLTQLVVNSTKNQTVHIGNPTETTINDMAKMILQKLSIDASPIPQEGFAGSVGRRCADVGRMLDIVGDYDFIDLEQGLSYLE